MLLVEFGLGICVNLHGHLPDADRGAHLGTGFARAFSGGPVGLSLHAALGVLLLASATVDAGPRNLRDGEPVHIRLAGNRSIAPCCIPAAASPCIKRRDGGAERLVCYTMRSPQPDGVTGARHAWVFQLPRLNSRLSLRKLRGLVSLAQALDHSV